MSDKNRSTLVIWLVILCVAVSIGILWAFVTANTAFVYGLGIFNIIFGPTCLIFYLIEVKKGVFAMPEGEE